MLDILYSYDINHISGPTKVVANLLKGLDKIGCDYRLNSNKPRGSYVYIPNGKSNLFKIIHKRSSQRILLGPNLFTFPGDIPCYIKPLIVKANGYLQPCDWAIEVWQLLDFNLLPLLRWPVGIDTELFYEIPRPAERRVLIYHKERNKDELACIERLLDSKGIGFSTIHYGRYSQTEYLELLKKSSLMIWHGCHESQGIALLEALSCNIPALVWDASSFYQMEAFPSYPFADTLRSIRVTSAPYFDNRCGIKIQEMSQLSDALDHLLDSLHEFTPRAYILENMTLEGQARRLLELFEYC